MCQIFIVYFVTHYIVNNIMAKLQRIKIDLQIYSFVRKRKIIKHFIFIKDYIYEI